MKTVKIMVKKVYLTETFSYGVKREICWAKKYVVHTLRIG